MRICLTLCLGVLVVCGAAYAQTNDQPNPAPAPKDLAAPAPKDLTTATLPKVGSRDTPEQIKERGKAWFQQCMQDWDTATHMTKTEWERTCRRVSLERTKFLIEQAK
jgi:hypothetical protein